MLVASKARCKWKNEIRKKNSEIKKRWPSLVLVGGAQKENKKN
jgi:hypothetical protein